MGSPASLLVPIVSVASLREPRPRVAEITARQVVGEGEDRVVREGWPDDLDANRDAVPVAAGRDRKRRQT